MDRDVLPKRDLNNLSTRYYPPFYRFLHFFFQFFAKCIFTSFQFYIFIIDSYAQLCFSLVSDISFV
ncbi:hypothetical protein EG68_11049 [Paragonimus skrjabini miyazakii]|uniref:Uncharacterized protein n=1 Tax=Paragonimus skrjabini miyazakii TaxID=59628 RepID=A0A8S9YEQ1_9TREM|nr:hypothetical protein EG68_11049 [Paragonimus skrjabini miyazakii]